MPILLSKAKFGKSQYYDDFNKRKNRSSKGAQVRPASSFRRNNPHPKANFLLPKTMSDSGGDDTQARLEIAQRKYLDHLGYSQADPPAKVLHSVLKASQKIGLEEPRQEAVAQETRPAVGTSDFIQESLKLLEASKKGDRGESKRERGNNYREGAKGYGATPSPPKSGKPTTANSNRGRSPQLLDSSGANLVQSTKRSHPTTPPGGGYRSQSVSFGYPRVADKKVNKRPVTAAEFSSLSPRMKSWINGANEYEKEVAYNLFQTLRADANGNTRKGSALPRATGVYVPGTKMTTKESMNVQNMMNLLDKDIHREYNISTQSPKFSEGRPRARKTWRAPSSYDDYTHPGSNFQQTRPQFMKSFDIAPDWCSEAKTYRRLVRKSAQNRGYKSV